jgi:hypothetical protein
MTQIPKDHLLQQENRSLNALVEYKDLKKAYLNSVLVCFEIFVSYYAVKKKKISLTKYFYSTKLTRAVTIICCSESRFKIVRLAFRLNTNGY